MARKVIVQTGRLDSSYRLEIEFEYKNVIGKSDLSSSFLTDTKYFNDANRLIIYPISLIFQDRLLKFKDDPFIEQIDNLEIDEYIREPQDLFKDHPQSKDASFMVASSLGKYKFKGMDYSLKGSLDLITTGFCYQCVLRTETVDAGYALHGLNALYLKDTGWFRVDPRGNKPGVESRFSIEREKLAYPIRESLGEVDHPYVFTSPLESVLTAMQESESPRELFYNRPESL